MEKIRFIIGDMVLVKHLYVVEGSSIVRRDVEWIGEIASEGVKTSLGVQYRMKKDGENCFCYYHDSDIVKKM